MTKQEVLERLCILCNDVAVSVVNFPENPADCFCTTTRESIGYHMDERVIEYIERVVYESGINRQER